MKKRKRFDYKSEALAKGYHRRIETGFGWANLKGNGYYQVSIKVDGKWKQRSLHLLIWEMLNGIPPPGFQVHHKDHDQCNNHIDNLELVNIVDHRRIHCGWIMNDDEWTHKPCTLCKRIKPIEDFYQDYYRKSHRKIIDTKKAYEGRCKDCCRKRALNGFYANKAAKALHATPSSA